MSDKLSVKKGRSVVRRRKSKASTEAPPEVVVAESAAPEPAIVDAAPAAEVTPVAESAPPKAPAEADAPSTETDVVAAVADENQEAPKAETTPVESEAPTPVKEEKAETGSAEEPPVDKFKGLGSAVIGLPEGYDPANPEAYRQKMLRDQEATKATTSTPYGRRRAVVNPTGAPTGGRGRRDAANSNDRFMRKKKKTRGKSTGTAAPSPAPKGNKRKIKIDNVISVGQLAHQMGLKASVIIKQLMGLGVMATVNEMLDFETAEMVAIEFEYEIENVGFQEEEVIGVAAHEESDEGGETCPPVVTIMGHVDHGKTTLLDAIRNAKVAAGEFGGITQHIGAYQVEANGSLITFIDTPGHAAFSEMRARGAAVTDIVILVVAVDDGVQAQTVEAISHSRAAGVPIIVAINKMDKPDANPENIKKRLTEYEVLSEEWGGDTMFVPVSALAETGLDELLDAVNLQAEMLELKANADRPADGVVVEAQQVRGRGSVATVLVRGGTLNKGDHVVMGTTYGKVRQMVSHTGARVKSAGPSTPVGVSGLSGVPEAGDAMSVVKSERDAKSIAQHRLDKKKQELLAATRRRTAADLFAAANEAGIKQLNVVLKADVRGSLEALRAALEAIEVEGARVNVLHHGVGDISESDVSLVSANNGLLLGFNVRVDARARKSAESQSIAPERYTIIYDVIDRVKGVMRSLIGPVYEDVREGTAVVRQVFSVSKVGTIAGCHVQDGKIGRNFHIRLIRNNVQVWEGKLLTLKRFKDDVTEVTHGYECGVGLEGYNEIEEGDVLEAFVRKEVVE